MIIRGKEIAAEKALSVVPSRRDMDMRSDYGCSGMRDTSTTERKRRGPFPQPSVVEVSVSVDRVTSGQSQHSPG